MLDDGMSFMNTKQVNDQEYAYMVASIQTWYTRMSTQNKIILLRSLLYKIKSTEQLRIILMTLFGMSGKAPVYSDSE